MNYPKARLIAIAMVILGFIPWNICDEAHADPLVYTAWDADDDPAMVATITNTVADVAVKFPEISGVTVGSAPIGGDEHFAQSSSLGMSIMINEMWMSNPAAFNQAIADDIAIGFHAPLGRCTGAQYMAFHESAHIIDYVHGRKADWTVTLTYGSGDNLRGYLSKYSFDSTGLDPAEALAEAYASVTCNGGNEVEHQFADILVGS